MKPEQENFDPLCRLLKLKRYEQPPPRYFNDFSGRVIARVRAGEAGGREAALDGGSWLVKLWSLIAAKPMLPGAVGVAICAVLVFGAVVTDPAPNLPGSEFIPAQAAPPAQDPILALNHGESRSVPAAFANTNPVIRLGGSLFDQIPLPPPELVSRPFGNN